MSDIMLEPTSVMIRPKITVRISYRGARQQCAVSVLDRLHVHDPIYSVYRESQ